jgi:hypothetical protein
MCGPPHRCQKVGLAIPLAIFWGKTRFTPISSVDTTPYLSWEYVTDPDGMERPDATTDQKVAIASAGQSMVLSLLCRGHAIAS